MNTSVDKLKIIKKEIWMLFKPESNRLIVVMLKAFPSQ